MLHFDKSKYMDLEFNGYKWFGFDNGFHMFSKRVGDLYATIEATQWHIDNGDIEFMAKHDLTCARKFWAKKALKYVEGK